MTPLELIDMRKLNELTLEELLSLERYLASKIELLQKSSNENTRSVLPIFSERHRKTILSIELNINNIFDGQ